MIPTSGVIVGTSSSSLPLVPSKYLFASTSADLIDYRGTESPKTGFGQDVPGCIRHEQALREVVEAIELQSQCPAYCHAWNYRVGKSRREVEGWCEGKSNQYECVRRERGMLIDRLIVAGRKRNACWVHSGILDICLSLSFIRALAISNSVSSSFLAFLFLFSVILPEICHAAICHPY